MKNKNRSDLKRYFREGSLPSESHFVDLIDSSLNIVEDGFNKTPENGFEVSLVGDHERLISFFRSVGVKNVAWSINYDKKEDRLLFKRADVNAPPVMTFAGDGKVGVNKICPEHEFDVDGVIASKGRIGTNPSGQKSVPANGEWHNISKALSGCHAFEVMAGVGSKGTGKYALINAVALNTFNPRGLFFNFLNLKKRIKYHQAYYLSRFTRIKLRWFTEGEKYYLQIRTNSDYGANIYIRFYLTQLWFDEYMEESKHNDDSQKIKNNND